jgi:S-adenosylmethionine hydrolase
MKETARKMTSEVAQFASGPLISLLTDFGLVDSYVSEMKAVILSICPPARIVDITHLVDKFNIRVGAFLLASAAPAFPTGTTHVGVVDPGVGSTRRAIVVKTNRSLFVGPDNGLLIPAAQAEGILHVYEVSNRSTMMNEVSATFHGRDVFAAAAAHLASGRSEEECGNEIMDYVTPSYSKPRFDGKMTECEVFHIDGFGNIVTNLAEVHLPALNIRGRGKMTISIGKRRFSARKVKTYSDLEGNEIGLLIGGHGFLEISCKERSAAKLVGARVGVSIRLSRA